jgi:hypothetical protein
MPPDPAQTPLPERRFIFNLTYNSGSVNEDDFVKCLDAVYHLQVTLRFILRHCGVRHSTPHSSGFTRLACGHFTKPSHFHGF